MLEDRLDRLGEFLEQRREVSHELFRTATPSTVLTTPSDREIRIERIFDAPRELVWRAFTEPELVAQWWGRGNKLVIERHGGRTRRPLAFRRALPRRSARVRGPLPRGDAARADRADLRVGRHAGPRGGRHDDASRTSATAAPRSSPHRCSTPPKSGTACSARACRPASTELRRTRPAARGACGQCPITRGQIRSLIEEWAERWNCPSSIWALVRGRS